VLLRKAPSLPKIRPQLSQTFSKTDHQVIWPNPRRPRRIFRNSSSSAMAST